MATDKIVKMIDGCKHVNYYCPCKILEERQRNIDIIKKELLGYHRSKEMIGRIIHKISDR